LARGSAASNLVATFGANRNQLIGAATAPGSGTDAIVFPAGTALATMATDTAGLQGSAVSGIVNLFSINESNEVGRLTPGGVSLPRDFAPGSFTVQANRFVRFPSYLSLGAGETATLESGAELRID
jgi:hypothetical protein